jgi:hypothetical protein
LAKLFLMRFFSVNEYGCEEITSFAIYFSGSRGPAPVAETLRAHGDAPFARRLFRECVAHPGLVVGLYQPLADGGADVPASPDHASLLQSLQKTKRSGLITNPLVFGFLPKTAPGRSRDRPLAPGPT